MRAPPSILVLTSPSVFLVARSSTFAGLLALSATLTAPVWGPPQAQAQPAQDVLVEVIEWGIPSDCASAEAFALAVAAELGAQEGARSRPLLQVRVWIEDADGEMVLHLQTSGRSEGQRELRGQACRELVATAAVITSMAVSAEQLFDEPLPESVRQAHDDEQPGLAEVNRLRLLAEDEGAERDLRLASSIGVISDLGTLPDPGVALSLMTAALFASYRVDFELQIWARQRQTAVETRDAGGEFDYLSTTARFCRRLPTSHLQGGLCGMAQVGRLRASGFGVDLARSQSHPLVALGGGLYIELPITARVKLFARADFAGQLLRPDYYLENPHRDLHQPTAALLRMATTLEVRF